MKNAGLARDKKIKAQVGQGAKRGPPGVPVTGGKR